MIIMFTDLKLLRLNGNYIELLTRREENISHAYTHSCYYYNNVKTTIFQKVMRVGVNVMETIVYIILYSEKNDTL